VRLRGQPTQSATFDRLTDARKWAQDTESAIRDGRYFKYAEAKKHTLADLIDRYLLWVKKRNPKRYIDIKPRLEWWRAELGYCLLADLNKAIIAEKLDELAATPKSNGEPRAGGTVNRAALILSHVITIAINEWEWMQDHPMRKIRKMPEPRGRVRFLSDEERKDLLEACKSSVTKHLYMIVVLALSTGARRGELMGLKWPDIDFERKVITLHETKNGERRLLPLTGHALDLLQAYAKDKEKEKGLIFASAVNPKKPFEFRTAWETALKVANVDDFRFHDLRHSTASYLAMNGATPAEIAEVLGHKTLQMVKRYAHLSQAHTHSVVESMNNKIFGVGDESR
jgi:integrase